MHKPLQRVGIVGAGAMGRGIAQVCAAAGCDVLVLDTQPGAVSRALAAVRDELGREVSKGRLSAEVVQATLARLRPADDLQALAACDLVVEAIVERLDVKQGLFRDLESVVAPDCILASNTSSLSVTAIAAACRHPHRVAGWHFFNPVPRMRVVEVVQAPRTAADVVSTLAALSQRLGHRAVITADSPGFVVNHAGRAFVTEGLKLLAERVAEHPVLDGILRCCAGFRMGPFELLDLTGLDVSVPVMESIHGQFYGDDRYRPAALARTRLMAGLLGRKSGEGFYRYGDAAVAEPSAHRTAGEVGTATVWWPDDGPGALPAPLAALLPAGCRRVSPADADIILLAPTATDLSTCVSSLGLEAAKAIAVDPVFSGPQGITLMVCPATRKAVVEKAQTLFAQRAAQVFVISDSPGYVAPRVVACIVNLACEMAQQGVASPADIDAAVRLGLGYPSGPFEWGDRWGARDVLGVLQGLQTAFGDPRYRPSPWLLRRAQLGLPLSAPDRSES